MVIHLLPSRSGTATDPPLRAPQKCRKTAAKSSEKTPQNLRIPAQGHYARSQKKISTFTPEAPSPRSQHDAARSAAEVAAAAACSSASQTCVATSSSAGGVVLRPAPQIRSLTLRTYGGSLPSCRPGRSSTCGGAVFAAVMRRVRTGSGARSSRRMKP